MLPENSDNGIFYDLALQLEKMAIRINEINSTLASNLNGCNKELKRLGIVAQDSE
jgi:hypothetical protein